MSQNKFVLIMQGCELILTEDERDFYLKEVAKGKKLVQIRNYTIPQLIYGIVPFDEWQEKETIKAHLRAGHWECNYGYWHNAGEKCGHHLAMRGNLQTEKFIGLGEIIKARLEGKIAGEYKQIEGDIDPITEEVKIQKLEEAETQGRDVDWYSGKVLE